VSDAVGYYIVRGLSALFGLLPEPAMRALGRAVGYLVSFVARGRMRTTMRHQARVRNTAAGARGAARRVFASYGRYWAEAFWVRPRRREQILARTRIVHAERLHDAVASGRGVILALPHVGNWEIAGLRAAAEGARVLAVAEALPNERIVEWFTEMRATMDIDIVIARKGTSVTRTLVERLRRGGTIALLCDRDLKGTGVPVELFGEETTMPPGPAALADRTGALLLPVGCYFEPGGRHRFDIHAPLEIPDLPTAEERVAAATRRLAGVVEEIVRMAPEQWHLVVPNWPSDRDDAS
jgi:KDO2-lipid IV(A) lauroyltransferase